ncbi:MAG: beta-ketoacyl-[acyl-carrier-protein] synthase family protein [Deltaproteobacteria bacterium]|nr:beta-ketoacyl-[acyl-carrier-protein] synthase family protein [Deltaproteobacteria bacterium]
MAVVITGMGCVTPIGTGRPAFSAALRRGESGTRRLSRFDPGGYECQVAAEVVDFRAEDFMPLREVRSLPRVAQLAVAGARLAMEDARLRAWPDPTRVGVLLGTSGGSGSYQFEQGLIFVERGVRRMHPSFPAYAHNGVIASECAIQLDAHGPVFTVSSACTSSTDAIGLACALLEAGTVDFILAGGSDAPLAPLLFASFDRLGAMARRFNDRPEQASRPFAADRDGFVLGEGAGVFVLEKRERARERSAPILAEIAGYGATCDAAHHFTQEESGVDATRAVVEALRQGNLSPDDVDYVNAHGTATAQNDPFETAIFHRVFGERAPRLPVSSTKSMVGHLLGACGAVELAATIVGMHEGFLPPTLNLDEPDPACDLDYVAHRARPAQIDVALSTSFGFGSRNAALVVRKPDDAG